MNAVEIEEAISALAEKPFDAAEFPFEFLSAFGNKETTVRRLRTRSGNTSDVNGGVLQRNHIHLATAAPGRVSEMLDTLRVSPKTESSKARFILATDGVTLEAEDLITGETIAPSFEKLASDFAFFLPLAGIATVKAIKNNPIDIKATGRLNKLYIELLKENPDWGTPERRHDLNQFMARLIFCFFAEDTGIFLDGLFTNTIRQMSDTQGGNTHQILAEMFRAMNTPTVHDGRYDNRHRNAAGIKAWADGLPYVNGGMFGDSVECPRFSRLARTYLLRAGELDWRQINPDIFGSMIQAVADDDERGELGMHYTSVPNILKVLNPLFLDDLREQLERAGDNLRMLRTLRKRLSLIRVFDPACGSGNFLVIAYKEMRAIEAEIVRRSMDAAISWIPLSNFYGIEIKDFAAEIARLALLIAEFQCDVLYIDQMTAKLNVLPLHRTGNVVTANALRVDWSDICPPFSSTRDRTQEELIGDQLSGHASRKDQPQIETYICGNPPYKGARKQTADQKADLASLFDNDDAYKDCDYVSGWFLQVVSFISAQNASAALVSTSSICEGEQVQHVWSRIFERDVHLRFAYRPFKWANNASNNAGVHVVVIGLSRGTSFQRWIFEGGLAQRADCISPYLVAGTETFVSAAKTPLAAPLGRMVAGSQPRDGGNLILSRSERASILRANPESAPLLRFYSGTDEFIYGDPRCCLWITDDLLGLAQGIPPIATRISKVHDFRASSSAKTTRQYAAIPHKFAQRSHEEKSAIIVAATSSETRPYLPVALTDPNCIISNAAFALYGAPLWQFAIVASRLHLAWVATVCGKLETRYRYSITLGWNTFPVPVLTDQNKRDLWRCAEDILLAREAHFPATIAELYEPESMPENLRTAHERNDEVLERIYVGRRFRNDTERLEKLFELYCNMIVEDDGLETGQLGAKT